MVDPLEPLRRLVKDKRNPNRQFEQLKLASAQARMPFDREVWLNVAFYLGEQYSQWNSDTGTIQPIARQTPTDRTPRPVANKLMHFANQAQSFALQDRPTVDVLPASDDPLDLGNTSVSKAYAAYIADSQVGNYDKQLSDAVLWAIVGGEGYLKWPYNPRLRRPDILAVSPLDIFSDPYASSFAKCRYVIHSQFMDIEQVFDIWGIELKATSASGLDPVRSRLLQQMGAAPVLSGVVVNELWMRPSRRYPNGLYAVWTADRQLVAPTDFPYEHRRLPFTQVGTIPRPGSLHYDSPLRYMRSLQMELNKYHAQKIQTRSNFANLKWWIPAELELEQLPNDAPNQILRGQSANGMLRPEIMSPPQMPDNGDGEWIVQELQDTVGQHEVSQAQVPGRVEAAKAIEMLKESDTSRLAVLHQSIRDATAEGFWQVLQLAWQFVPDDTIIQTYSREGLPEVKRWRRDVVKPALRVRVTMGTGLARSRAAREEQILTYWDRGIITSPDTVAQMLDVAAPSFDAANAYDMRLARNENLEMADGTAVMPNSWDNHAIHLREHNNYRKTTEYLMLDTEAKQIFEFHCQHHDELEVQEMSKQLQKAQLAQALLQSQQGVPSGASQGDQPPQEGAPAVDEQQAAPVGA